MKKRIALLVLLLIPLFAWAADPLFETYAKATGAVTVDSTFDGTWEGVDSIVYVVSDAATAVYRITGVAVMDPGDVLWLGIANTLSSDSLPEMRNIDSMVIKHPSHNRGVGYYPINFSALLDTAAATDTAYFTAACGGHGSTDRVELTNVFVTVELGDDM